MGHARHGGLRAWMEVAIDASNDRLQDVRYGRIVVEVDVTYRVSRQGPSRSKRVRGYLRMRSGWPRVIA
jgi:hypothetical protein